MGLNNGVTTIGLKVSDSDGGVVTSAPTLTINNVAPTALHNGGYVINEGEDLHLTAIGSSDLNSNDILSYAWDLDDDGLSGAWSSSGEFMVNIANEYPVFTHEGLGNHESPDTVQRRHYPDRWDRGEQGRCLLRRYDHHCQCGQGFDIGTE